jgi:ankyrin repeat protein
MRLIDSINWELARLKRVREKEYKDLEERINIQNKDGMTPLIKASVANDIKAVKIMLTKFKDIDFSIRDNKGYDAVRYSRENDNQEMTELILEAMEAQNDSKNTK